MVKVEQRGSIMSVLQKHKEMLYPVVRVRTNVAGGSGTVIYSKPDVNGKIHTYVMTNHHVIADCIQVKKQWDEFFKKDIKKHPQKYIQNAIDKIGTGLGNEERLKHLKMWSIRTSKGGRILYEKEKDTATLVGYNPPGKHY